MASIINASTTSTSGLVQTADASGVLQLQSDGTTGLTVNSGGNVTVAGNLSSSGNVTVANNLTVSGNVTTPRGTVTSLVSGTAQTASGTEVNFTGIPSWVKRITVTLDGISAAASGGTMYVRIGNGTVATTGYWGVQLAVSGSTSSTVVHTTGIWVGSTGNAASSLMYSTLILTLHNASTNTWSGMVVGARDDSSNVAHSSYGRISLSGTLNVLSLVLSSSTFDAGSVNIMYE